jgi:hypothetical protein
MHEKIDTVVFNSINAGAVGITFIGIEQALTVLVLLTALLYNIKKLRNK